MEQEQPTPPSTRKPKRTEVKSHAAEMRKRVSLFSLIESTPAHRKEARQLKLGFGR